MQPTKYGPSWLFALVAVLVAVGVGNLVVSASNGTRTITISRATPPTLVPVAVDPGTQLQPAQAADDANKNTAAVGPGLHEDAKDETPPGVSPEQIQQGAIQTEATAQKELTAPSEPAGAQNYRCYQHHVVNFSLLTHQVIGVALHFTVSPPGSHLGVWRLFNTPSFGASSTFIWEPLTNLCWQLVPLDRKAWAQLTANSYYWSIEIVSNDETRAQWLATPMLKKGKLADLVADLLHKAGAPPKLVDPVGCNFLPGVTDHSRLECGNTHWDVGQHFPWDVFMRQVRQHYYGAEYKPACGVKCRQANDLRAKHVATHKSLSARHCSLNHPSHPVCKALVARNRVIHSTARAEKVTL